MVMNETTKWIAIINFVKLLIDIELDVVVPDVELPLVEVELPVVVVVFVVEVEP